MLHSVVSQIYTFFAGYVTCGLSLVMRAEGVLSLPVLIIMFLLLTSQGGLLFVSSTYW
jgi:hypothetical protein